MQRGKIDEKNIEDRDLRSDLNNNFPTVGTRAM